MLCKGHRRIGLLITKKNNLNIARVGLSMSIRIEYNLGGREAWEKRQN